MYRNYLNFNQFCFVYDDGHRAAVLTLTPGHVRSKFHSSANRSPLESHRKVDYFRKMFLKGKSFIRDF